MIRGFRCPEGKGDLPFQQCLECAATHENTCQFDYPILSCMYRNLRKGDGITVSSLLNCLRRVVLQARQDVYLDPKNLYFAFRGQLFHTVISQAHDEEAVVEQRFERTIAGITLSGHPDVIYPQKRKLVDYKSTKRIPKNDTPYASHGTQVNLYRYLAKPQYKIDKLEIVYFDMSNVKRIKVPLMNTNSLMSWLVPRLKKLKRAFDGGELPERVKSDGLWQCDGFCHFTEVCWPEGVPKPEELRKQEEENAVDFLDALSGGTGR